MNWLSDLLKDPNTTGLIGAVVGPLILAGLARVGIAIPGVSPTKPKPPPVKVPVADEELVAFDAYLDEVATGDRKLDLEDQRLYTKIRLRMNAEPAAPPPLAEPFVLPSK